MPLQILSLRVKLRCIPSKKLGLQVAARLLKGKVLQGFIFFHAAAIDFSFFANGARWSSVGQDRGPVSHRMTDDLKRCISPSRRFLLQTSPAFSSGLLIPRVLHSTDFERCSLTYGGLQDFGRHAEAQTLTWYDSIPATVFMRKDHASQT